MRWGRVAAVAAMVAGLAGAAKARNVYVLEADDNDLTLIDRDSIVWHGDYVRVDMTTVLPKPSLFEGSFWQIVDQMVFFDCSKHVKAEGTLTMKTLDGRVVQSASPPAIDWKEILPKTVYTMAATMVCDNTVPLNARGKPVDRAGTEPLGDTVANYLTTMQAYRKRHPR